jgi:hypothetical protein
MAVNGLISNLAGNLKQGTDKLYSPALIHKVAKRIHLSAFITKSSFTNIIDSEVAIVKGYPIEGGFAIAFFLCIFT